jgi:hypothetical protein
MFEPKVKQYVLRKFNGCTLELLKRFVRDFDIGGQQRLFSRSIRDYNVELKEAGKVVGIDFKVTTHTGMKHTFVSQSSAHGVSLEVVSEQCGTDPQTIREFYLGGIVEKMDAELLGRKVMVETWNQYVEKLHPQYLEKYEAVKGGMAKVNGIAKEPRRVKAEKAKVKRAFSWDRIEAITKSKPETEKGKRLVDYWVKVWRVHVEHPRLTYAEIKGRLT